MSLYLLLRLRPPTSYRPPSAPVLVRDILPVLGLQAAVEQRGARGGVAAVLPLQVGDGGARELAAVGGRVCAAVARVQAGLVGGQTGGQEGVVLLGLFFPASGF